MATIKLIVCDMAGTTVRDDGEVEGCFADACARVGIEIGADRIKAMQGWAKRHVFEILWTEILGPNHPRLDDRIDDSYAVFRKILENHYQTHPIVPTEGALELFEYCHRRGIRVALTTGFYRKVTDIILDRLGWLEGLNADYVSNGAGIIDCSVASDEVAAGRPEPDMIILAMRKLGIKDPQSVVNVGDTPSDLQSGRKAGVLASYGLTNGTHSSILLEPWDNDGLLPSIAHLISQIELLTSASIDAR